MANDTTNYPGWPKNFKGPSLHEWMNAVKKVPVGQGLIGSDVGGPLYSDTPPHPEYVKQWREQNAASVSDTARQFALSDVQVLEACR